SFLAGIGQAGAEFGRGLVVFADMLGAIGMATARVLTRPRDFRLTSTVNQLDRVAWQAVPIILLITFLIGGRISPQRPFPFPTIGAPPYAPDPLRVLLF